jgi:hypothetical protein
MVFKATSALTNISFEGNAGTYYLGLNNVAPSAVLEPSPGL